MSIGQKLEQVADLVYKKGKTDIVSNSKYIEKQATGKVIRLDDVSEVHHKVKIKAGATGKNKLSYPYKSTTKSVNGITYTDNGDGSVTVEGTATEYTFFYFTEEFPFKVGQTYTFGEDVLGVDMYVRYTDENGTTKYGMKKVTWKEGYTLLAIYLQVNPGSTTSGTVYPYLVEGDTYDGIWEPYIPPATELVEVTVYGKNLCDGILEIGGINDSTGANISISTSMRTVNYIPVLPNTTYTISREDTTKNIRTRVYDKDKNYIGYVFSATTSPFTITTKDNHAFMRLELVGVNLEEKLQFEYGKRETEYESYVGQTITATPEGTEALSTCPEMTIIADNDVTIEYWGSFGRNFGYLSWWGKYLNYGNPKTLYNAFGGHAWDDETFEPPFDINATTSSAIFGRTFITDVRGCMKKHNVRLICNDTNPNHNQHFSLFSDSKVKYLPYLKLPTNSSAYGWFTNCTQLIEVDGYECCEKNTFETSSGANKTFQGCTELVKIIFHGTVAKNCDIHWSTKLSRESILSLLQCLNVAVTEVTITLPSKCIDTATDTFEYIRANSELATPFEQALINGYTITFV